MSHEFYRVFRNGPFLHSTQELRVPTEADPVWSVEELHTQADALAVLTRLYSSGISRHGEQYLFGRYHSLRDDSGTHFTEHIPLLELTFELVRLHQFPVLPSHFTSFFGCETLDDAHVFREKFAQGLGAIHRVKCEQYFRADMQHLYLGAGIPSTFILAERYWRGQASPNPFWEILMQGPIDVLEQVG